MPGTNDLGPFGAGVNATTEEPSTFGDSGAADYTWFKDCTTPTSDDGTRFTARWANRTLKYIRRACDGMGITRNETDSDRLLKAIQKAIRPAANLGVDDDGVGVYKETDAETLTHMLRRLKGLGGIAIALAEGGNVINVDGSSIGGAGLALFYPEVETADGKLLVNIGSGEITVDDEQTFVHRGCRQIDCADYSAPARNFATLANKTYHLRWRWASGTPVFVLKDLADSGYNPTVAAETDAGFDSTYDDMLVAKVETNGSNGITVTSLVNRHALRSADLLSGAVTSSSGLNSASRTDSITKNWARTPIVIPSWYIQAVSPNGNQNFGGSDSHDHDNTLSVSSSSRYATSISMGRDHAATLGVYVMLQA